MRLKDKVAVITGATSGIGLACARRFAAEGAKVVMVGRRQELGRSLAASLQGRAQFVPGDVLQEMDVRAFVDFALSNFGRIDCVISNAGAGSTTTTIAASTASDLDRDVAPHVRAPFLAMKYASPAMNDQGSGSFINMSSVSAHRAGLNAFGYEVAKAALVHLTRCAAVELGEMNIRVNSISPGPTLTGIFGGGAKDAAAQSARIETVFTRLLPSVQAMPGMIHPEDVADAALFLASDEAHFVNGHDLIVDGGITAGRPARVMRASWIELTKALAESTSS